MSHDWMLDLISDLKGYAQKNAMTALSEHLDDALIIAAREIRGASGCLAVASPSHEQDPRISRASTENDIA